MDETRSTGSEARPVPPGRRALDAAADTPRDPVTGTPATPPPDSRRTPTDRKSPQEIEDDIRRTRAEMSETVDEIERRLSPERLKREAKQTVHETIDEVQDRFNPQRIAENAGRNMLDTVKDHPLPSLIAGLSLGYLFMKAGEGSGRDRRAYERRRYYGPPYDARYGRDVDYAPRRGYADAYDYEEDYYAAYPPRYRQDYDESDGRSVKDQAADKAGQAAHKVSDVAEGAKEQASDLAHEARRQARHVRHGARRAQSNLESFVYQNPLAAGAIAIGVGALFGGLLPSTHIEDEYMGETRDQAIHKAKVAAKEAGEHVAQKAESAVDSRIDKSAEQAKERVAHLTDEAKETVKSVADAAQDDTQSVKSAAKEGAHRLKEDVKHPASEKF